MIAKGQSNNGNCITLLNEECVAALTQQAKDIALTWSGQANTNQNCSALGDPPPACQQFGTAFNSSPINVIWLSDGLGAYDVYGIYNNVSSGGSVVEATVLSLSTEAILILIIPKQSGLVIQTSQTAK